MKKKLDKLVAILLITVFLLSTTVFGNNYDGSLEPSNVDNAFEELRVTDSNIADVFRVHYTPGAAYYGYIFRLVENAIVPYEENENIQILFAPQNLFHATTLQDIVDFVAPEMIMHIEPNYKTVLEPMNAHEYIPPTFAPHAFAGVNDPYYQDQWCLDFIRGAASWSTDQAPSTNGIMVAVIDSGVDRYHEDFDSYNILPGRNFVIVPGRDRYNTNDDYGHGTMVTGVIAATRNNGLGIASMACGVSILPLRVDRIVGGQVTLTQGDVVSAILYAIEEGAHIINMSINFPTLTMELANAVNQAANNNIWMIAAVGNDGGTAIRYPAGLSNVIGVGAITRHGVRAGFSNHNNSVFVTAPGADMILMNTGNRYIHYGGTSQAAPKITALAAIARAHNPNMTKDTFRNLLRNSAIHRGAPGWDSSYGYGIIDVGLFMYNLTNRDFFNFTDVPQAHWARTEIWENARYGLLHGRVENYARGGYHGSHQSFHPTAPMWRLEFTMALGRLHELNGGNITWAGATFADVNPFSHFPFNYSRFVQWAFDRDIVQGVGGNNFNPGDAVTRQAAAVFFYRFSRFLAESCADIRAQLDEVLTPNFNPQAILRARFPTDYHEVATWAQREMAWAISVGLIEGRGTPQGTILAPELEITRAEGAALIARYRRAFLMHTFIKPRDAANPGSGPATTNWTMLNFNLGGTVSHPTYPATINPTQVLIADNISGFLWWFRGGAFVNGPTRDGYQFGGWYLDSAFSAPLTDAAVVPSGQLTLHARWEGGASGHSVTVNTQGYGTASANVTVAPAGEMVLLIATPGAGYRFVEWQVVSGDVVLSGAADEIAVFDMPDRAVVLLAVFVEVVEEVAVTGVAIQGSNFIIEVLDTRQLVADIIPVNATNQTIIWSSHDDAIADVDPTTGLVTGVAAGTTVIVATTVDGGHIAMIGVSVLPPPVVTWILGDVNGDNFVDQRDVQYLREHITGRRPVLAFPEAGDINGDGVLNQLDVQLLTMIVNNHSGLALPLYEAPLVLSELISVLDGIVPTQGIMSLGGNTFSMSLEVFTGPSPLVPTWTPPPPGYVDIAIFIDNNAGISMGSFRIEADDTAVIVSDWFSGPIINPTSFDDLILPQPGLHVADFDLFPGLAASWVDNVYDYGLFGVIRFYFPATITGPVSFTLTALGPVLAVDDRGYSINHNFSTQPLTLTPPADATTAVSLDYGNTANYVLEDTRQYGQYGVKAK